VVAKNIDSVRGAQAQQPPADGLRTCSVDLLRKTHQTIRKVTTDIEKDYHFNTAIAALMELVNELAAYIPENDADSYVAAYVIRNTVLMLAPFAPHVAEELWAEIGGRGSIFEQPWPAWDESLAADEKIELVVQVNGKLRAKIMVPAGLSDADAKARALSDAKVMEHTRHKQIVKVVVVQGRLVNVVVK